MVTLAQRLEALRTKAGLSRAALSAELGFPKGAFEKFETGRQTPTKEQQEKMAAYFGVSLFYLRGESNDPTRQDDWMDGSDLAEAPRAVSAPAPQPPSKRTQEAAPQGALLDSFLMSKQVRELLHTIVLDTLKSPEAQAILAKAIQKERSKQS